MFLPALDQVIRYGSFSRQSRPQMALLSTVILAVVVSQVIYTQPVMAKSSDRPNIVLVMADDQGWGDMAYTGHPHLKTPVLDEMAAIGLRFERFYAAHPTCSPTRGSVLTGRHPNRYGTFTPNFSLRPEEITIAQLLKTKGYVCGHFGKWHVGPEKSD